MMFRALSIVALAAYASAQSLPDSVSDTCTNTLRSIALNAEVAACLNPVALVSLISGNSSTSITPAVDNWLSGLCAAPACRNETIDALVANVTAGCSQELSTQGITPEDNAVIASSIQTYYPTARSIFCLKEGSTFCITQTLQNFETSLGRPLSLDNIVGMFIDPPTSLSQNVTCTNCIKEAYNIIKKDIPSGASLLEGPLNAQCDASFTDGSSATGITQSAVQGTASPSGGNNGALNTLSGATIAFSGLVASTVFTLLA